MYKNFEIVGNKATNEADNYVIYYDGCYLGTSLTNYNSRIMNARTIVKFDCFASFEECIDYYDKYFRRDKK